MQQPVPLREVEIIKAEREDVEMRDDVVYSLGRDLIEEKTRLVEACPGADTVATVIVDLKLTVDTETVDERSEVRRTVVGLFIGDRLKADIADK